MAFRGEFKFLSNFYEHPLIFDARMWRTAEHAYQASKCLYPADRDHIQLLRTAGQAKHYGRMVERSMDFKVRKLEIMYAIVKAKFADPELAEKLLKIEGPIIEFNNWHDHYWGQCVCDEHGKTAGHNHLGKILMRVRDELRQGRLL